MRHSIQPFWEMFIAFLEGSKSQFLPLMLSLCFFPLAFKKIIEEIIEETALLFVGKHSKFLQCPSKDLGYIFLSQEANGQSWESQVMGGTVLKSEPVLG